MRAVSDRCFYYIFIIIFKLNLVPHCRERWRNLRACLTRHLKNQRISDGQKKPYYLYETLQFLCPHIRKRSARDTFIVTSKRAKQEMDSNTSEGPFTDDETKVQVNDGSDDEDDDIEEHDSAADQTTPPSTDIKHNIKEHEDEFDVVVNAQPTMKQRRLSSATVVRRDNILPSSAPAPPTIISNTIISPPADFRATTAEFTAADAKEIEDADASFFKSLLPDIRQMTRSQKRKFKVGIIELIDSIFENQ